MTTKAHATLTGSDLHEVKGVATATDNQVLTASGGASVWKKLDATNLSTTGNPFGAQLLHLNYSGASGTTAQALIVATYQTGLLNTVVTNEISGASLASNTVTLPAGTYFVEAHVPYTSSGSGIRCQASWYNTTDSAYVVTGTSTFCNPATSTISFIRGRFTIAGSKNFQLFVFASGNCGLGTACALGITETYQTVLIWKIA